MALCFKLCAVLWGVYKRCTRCCLHNKQVVLSQRFKVHGGLMTLEASKWVELSIHDSLGLDIKDMQVLASVLGRKKVAASLFRLDLRCVSCRKKFQALPTFSALWVFLLLPLWGSLFLSFYNILKIYLPSVRLSVPPLAIPFTSSAVWVFPLFPLLYPGLSSSAGLILNVNLTSSAGYKLIFLPFSYNALGEEGCAVLAPALKGLKSLQTLLLWSVCLIPNLLKSPHHLRGPDSPLVGMKVVVWWIVASN